MSARNSFLITTLIPALALGACAVGPNYKRPGVETPPAFKEAQGWTPARPADGLDKGDWWSMFEDPILDGLERKVSVSNQTLAADEAAYIEAHAVVNQQRASLFPTVDLTGSATRTKHGGTGAQTTSTVPGRSTITCASASARYASASASSPTPVDEARSAGVGGRPFSTIAA